MFIGCHGLFGMSSYTAELRTKEIGVRKVLGASVTGIMVIIIITISVQSFKAALSNPTNALMYE